MRLARELILDKYVRVKVDDIIWFDEEKKIVMRFKLPLRLAMNEYKLLLHIVRIVRP